MKKACYCIATSQLERRSRVSRVNCLLWGSSCHLCARPTRSAASDKKFLSRVFPARPSAALMSSADQARAGRAPVPSGRAISVPSFLLAVFIAYHIASYPRPILLPKASDHAGSQGRDPRQKGKARRAQAPARAAPERVYAEQSPHW
jgi:hypothetical protein